MCVYTHPHMRALPPPALRPPLPAGGQPWSLQRSQKHLVTHHPRTRLRVLLLKRMYNPSPCATCPPHRTRPGQEIQCYLISNGCTILHPLVLHRCSAGLVLLVSQMLLLVSQHRVWGCRDQATLTSPSNSSISPPSTRMVTRFLHFREG